MRNLSVFISYAREDQRAAREVASGLKREGFSVFLDEQRLRAGRFGAQLERAIGRCDVFVLLISPFSVASTYVNRELHVAADDYERPVLPVVLEETDLGPFRLVLGGLQRVPYSTESPYGIEAVVDGVYRTAAQARRLKPSAGARTARVVGTVIAGLGLVLFLGGMGGFFLLFATAWNSQPGDQPSPLFPVMLGVCFVGFVVSAIGEGIRRTAARRGHAWR